MMEIIYSEDCLMYSYPDHIESPSRVKRAFEILSDMGYKFISPKPATEEELLRVHSKQWIEKVKEGGFIDPDTPGHNKIYEYARLSAGGAIEAAKRGGFSLLRPPGHHAGKNGKALGAHSLGFCYFNNIAVAIRALKKKALIIDIDGHHGNGTQEIFLGDPEVVYISIHGIADFPFTGFESEKNCINIPVQAKTGDRNYLEKFEWALSQVDLKDVEIIGISAGFDACIGEIASLELTERCYRRIGEILHKFGKKVFGVLEGGYSGERIAACLHQLLTGLEDDSAIGSS